MVGGSAQSTQGWETVEQDGFRQNLGSRIVVWIGELPVQILESWRCKVWVQIDLDSAR